MKYLFDMGEVWHVYSDVGNQWIYQRLEQTGEEILEKSGDNLPGPLGRLDMLKQLESECTELRKRMEAAEESKEKALIEYKQQKEESLQKLAALEKNLLIIQEKNVQEKQQALDAQKASFEKSYRELQHMAEELQKEGKLWRQRYLDLSYQIAQKAEK